MSTHEHYHYNHQHVSTIDNDATNKKQYKYLRKTRIKENSLKKERRKNGAEEKKIKNKKYVLEKMNKKKIEKSETERVDESIMNTMLSCVSCAYFCECARCATSYFITIHIFVFRICDIRYSLAN